MISIGCVFVSALALLVSALSLYNSTAANAKVDYELRATQEEVTIMKNTMALQNVYLQKLYFLMQKEGLDPPPLLEE